MLNSNMDVRAILTRLTRIGVTGPPAYNYAQTADPVWVASVSDSVLAAAVGAGGPPVPHIATIYTSASDPALSSAVTVVDGDVWLRTS